MQELLRAEAMRNRLCEETIAAEMRADDVADDVFSKAFGKKTVRGVGKQNPRSINPSRNVLQVSTTNDGGSSPKQNGNGVSNENDASLFAASPAFRKRLALALGYADARALDLAVAKGRAARRAFVTHNFGLAARVADDIFGKLSASDRGLLSRDDLTLYGCAGLARAADRFDPDRGYKFSTYCYFWVRKAVLDGVKDCGRTIRLPKYLSEVLRETRKAERDLEAKLGRAPSDVELAEATETDVARVREWRDWARTPLSLDAGAGGGAADADDGALVDGIAAVTGSASGVPTQSVRHTEDGPAASAEADADVDCPRRAGRGAATLLPREQFVLRHRFGLARAARAPGVRVHERRRAPGLAAGVLRGRGGCDGAGGGQGRRVAPAARVPAGRLRGDGAHRRAARWPSSSSPRAGACCRTWTTRPGRAWSRATRGLFAAALAEAAEKADRRAGGGRVSGPSAARSRRAPSRLPRRKEKRERGAGRGAGRRRGDASRAAGRKCRGPRAQSGVPGERRGDGRDEQDAGDGEGEGEGGTHDSLGVGTGTEPPKRARDAKTQFSFFSLFQQQKKTPFRWYITGRATLGIATTPPASSPPRPAARRHWPRRTPERARSARVPLAPQPEWSPVSPSEEKAAAGPPPGAGASADAKARAARRRAPPRRLFQKPSALPPRLSDSSAAYLLSEDSHLASSAGAASRAAEEAPGPAPAESTRSRR